MPKIKFKGSRALGDEYHGLFPAGEISFFLGEVKDLDSAIAQRLLSNFPTAFEVVAENELVDSPTNLVDNRRGRGRPAILREEVEKRFGRAIEQLLSERKGETIRQIAKELGVSKSLIGKWKRDIR